MGTFILIAVGLACIAVVIYRAYKTTDESSICSGCTKNCHLNKTRE